MVLPNFARADTLTDAVAAGFAESSVQSPWRTTVIRNDVAGAPQWPAALVARAPEAATTGSIGPRAGKGTYSPAGGPRLTGTPHALNGLASYYGQGHTTAMGERFDRRAMTAAHKTLPFGTRVKVTRLDTGGSVVVRINDRGPFKQGRVIDLSEGAAENLGLTSIGLTPVRLEVLGQ